MLKANPARIWRENDVDFEIDGELTAVGTQDEPIIFKEGVRLLKSLLDSSPSARIAGFDTVTPLFGWVKTLDPGRYGALLDDVAIIIERSLDQMAMDGRGGDAAMFCVHRLIEEELKTNFSTVDFDYLQVNLEKALVEGLEIVESFEMERGESAVTVSLRGSIFDNPKEEPGGESAKRLGDDPCSWFRRWWVSWPCGCGLLGTPISRLKPGDEGGLAFSPSWFCSFLPWVGR